MNRSSFLASSIVAVTVLVASGCTQLPHRAGSATVSSENARIEDVGPVDVAVLPVENATGTKKKLPVKPLREALEAALVGRRYTPLATEYVDRETVDASFKPGSLREDATLHVAIEGWDDTLWSSNSAVVVRVRAHIDDSKGSGELWSARLERRFDLGRDRDRFPTEEPLLRLLCTRIADELLAALPARPAKPGRATTASNGG